MIDEHKEELSALYALGLLAGEELTSFEAELKGDPELRQLVASLQQAGANLALTAPSLEPSAALRERVLAGVAKLPISGRPTSHPVPAEGPKSIPFPFPAWPGWAIAAGFALVAAYVGTQWLNTRTELANQRGQLAMSEIQVRTLKQQLEADQILSSREIADLQKAGDLAELKIAKLASLNGNSPEAVAIAVWNPLKQEGILSVQGLPVINADQSYQLWVVDSKHKEPVSGGVFSVDDKGKARLDFRPDDRADAATHFAISRERKGGVPVRQGPIVALGAL